MREMIEVNVKDLDVNPRIIHAALKVGFSSAWKLLEVSVNEVKNRTGLSAVDVGRLITAASARCSPLPMTALELDACGKDGSSMTPIQLGCKGVDEFLKGGVPYRGITEIAGRSGSGKTQLLLQVAIRAQLSKENGGLSTGVAYICTENQFPANRLNQLTRNLSSMETFNQKVFSDNIFVHHLPDMDQLIDCVIYVLPKLMSTYSIKVVIIDSVAAVFRAEEGPQMDKSRMLQKLGYHLHKLAFEEHASVLVANQVTASFGNNIYGIPEDMIPALGLSWANLITTRIMLWKTLFCVLPSKDHLNRGIPESAKFRVRNMEVLYCPWLPRRSFPFVVTDSGIEDTDQFAGQHVCPELES